MVRNPSCCSLPLPLARLPACPRGRLPPESQVQRLHLAQPRLLGAASLPHCWCGSGAAGATVELPEGGAAIIPMLVLLFLLHEAMHVRWHAMRLGWGRSLNGYDL